MSYGMGGPSIQRNKLSLRVAVVDSHPLMREGQRAILSSKGSIQIVGEAGTGLEALRLVKETRPDLVIVDSDLAGKPSGVDLCRRIKTLPEAPYILVFTAGHFGGDLPADYLVEIDGYLHKGSSSEELLDSARRVAAGEKVWKGGGATEERGDGPVPPPGLEGSPLTPRELEVLAMKLHRRTNAEIAATLHISLNTVKHHVSSIYKKLAKTRKDLLRT